MLCCFARHSQLFCHTPLICALLWHSYIFSDSLINRISGYQISIQSFVNSLVLHAAVLQVALYHKCTYLNIHVLHAAVLLVSICELAIGVKYINKYSDIRLLRHMNIQSLKTSIRCSPSLVETTQAD